MRIAIVEDEPRIREGIHKLLARTNDSSSLWEKRRTAVKV